MITVYISIGNSDDKLSQADWAKFVREVDAAVTGRAERIHGRWFSAPDAAFQNACWCVELLLTNAGRLKEDLSAIRRFFRQDSVAWAETPGTLFV